MHGFRGVRFAVFFLCILIVGLIGLGGATRAMNAGVACPDWPLCFGQFIPDFHPQVYLEFMHRAIAGLVSILTFGVAFIVFRHPQSSQSMKTLMGFALLILMVQVVMGGLTVLYLVHFATVTIHLALGTAFFGAMLWLYFLMGREGYQSSFSSYGLKSPPVWVRWMFFLSAIVVYGQILLGGLVASNFAALACPDFPLCNGQFIPTMEGPIGIHLVHRFGAYITAIVLLLTWLALRMSRDSAWMQDRLIRTSRVMISLVVLQICIGIANIKFQVPPLLTVLHLVTAVSLFGLTLRLVYFSKPADSRM